MTADFVAEWGLSPKLKDLDHRNFHLNNNFDKDLDVTDRKVLEYIGSIESALQEYDVEVDGTVQVYESEHTTERNFDDILRDESSTWTPEETLGGGMPTHKGEEYFDMIESSIEALHAIQAYEGHEVEEEFEMYDIGVNSYEDLVDQISDTDRHILGASVEYETDLGTVEFSFHSPNIHLENHDFDEEDRRRDNFERLRNQYPLGIDVYGDEELRETVDNASTDFNNKWNNQLRNQVYDLLK